MDQQQLNRVMARVRHVCSGSGGRITEKRKRILELLLSAEIPLSAYEIKDAYTKAYAETIPTMSVYRIVDFFETEHLVHKLSSTKKYVACSHIESDRAHDAGLFLVCCECKAAIEMTVPGTIISKLSAVANNVGYTLSNTQLEMECLCDHCTT